MWRGKFISNVALRTSLVRREDVKSRPCRSTTILSRSSLLDQLISGTSLHPLGRFLQLFPVILRMVHIPLNHMICHLFEAFEAADHKALNWRVHSRVWYVIILKNHM
jgi:hypothetical protein